MERQTTGIETIGSYRNGRFYDHARSSVHITLKESEIDLVIRERKKIILNSNKGYTQTCKGDQPRAGSIPPLFVVAVGCLSY